MASTGCGCGCGCRCRVRLLACLWASQSCLGKKQGLGSGREEAIGGFIILVGFLEARRGSLGSSKIRPLVVLFAEGMV